MNSPQNRPQIIPEIIPATANATVTGGDVDGNQVFVSMDAVPPFSIWTVGARVSITIPAADPTSKAGDAVMVGRSELRMVMNALRADVNDGRQVRREMLHELEKSIASHDSNDAGDVRNAALEEAFRAADDVACNGVDGRTVAIHITAAIALLQTATLSPIKAEPTERTELQDAWLDREYANGFHAG